MKKASNLWHAVNFLSGAATVAGPLGTAGVVIFVIVLSVDIMIGVSSILLPLQGHH